MKHVFICCILIFCCLCSVLADTVPLHGTRQYAYIGGDSGIFGFRMKPDGSLQSLQSCPLAKGLFPDQLLVDTRARNIFGITVDDKLYSYAVGLTGHLALKSVIPIDVDFRTAVIDSQTHCLYAGDGDHSLLVYDIADPAHVVRRRNIATSIIIQNVAVDQANRSLLLCGHPRTAGQGGNVLLRYSLYSRSQLAQKKIARIPLQQSINTFTLAGPDLVAGNENTTLAVYNLKLGKPIELLSHQPLLGADAAHLPANIVYGRQGSFLYISTYYGAGGARAAQPASAVVVCHLGIGGQLGPQRAVGRPVPNPRPCLDKTGRFLYVVGEEGTLDSYKILSDGQLSPSGNRAMVPTPTGIVFVTGF